MTLANRISRLRKDKKLSQEFVAESLNVSRQAVSKWENGLSSPDMENLIALARLLEVDVEYLATGELTDDLDSDPAEEAVPEFAPKPKKDPKGLLTVLLSFSILLNLLFFGLWQHERNSEHTMEDFSVANAAAAQDAFADFVHYGSEADYWRAVGSFKAFMDASNWIREDFPYLECNILYTNLLFEQEKCTNYMEDIRRIMRLLKENPQDPNVYLEMNRLNNQIKYGD